LSSIAYLEQFAFDSALKCAEVVSEWLIADKSGFDKSNPYMNQAPTWLKL